MVRIFFVGGGGGGEGMVVIEKVITVCPILRCPKEQLSSCQPQRKKVDKYH